MRRVCLLALLLAGLVSAPARAAAPMLTLTGGGVTLRLSAAALLARADAVMLTLPHDSAYGRRMTFRAVPLRALLAQLPPDTADTIEARAADGFVSALPRSLLDGAATPWIAVEDPAHPWPKLPGRPDSAGPFYLVWQAPERVGIAAEQWPYALVALTEAPSPVQRWPSLAVAASVAAEAPARRGQTVFIANCLPCHRLAGDGAGSIGPDLLRPVPAAASLTDAGLRALIRNPAAARRVPAPRMPGFDPAAISDRDIDAVIAYLRYMTARR